MITPTKRFTFLLAFLLSGAHVQAAAVLPTLHIPGGSDAQPSELEENMMMLGFFTARNLLSGTESDDLDTIPCVEEDAGTTLMEQNTLNVYRDLKAALVRQGWQPIKEVKSPVGIAYAFMYSKSGVNLMGLWVQSQAPTAAHSRLSICQMAKNWMPRPAVKLPPLAENVPVAGKLPSTLKFTVEDWKRAGSLYNAAEGQEGDVLVLRGTVTAGGQVTLPLPGNLPAEVLTPANAWAAPFTVGSGACSAGVSISDPTVKVFVARELTYSPAGSGASSKDLLASGLDFLISGSSESDYSLRAVLVYATGPLTLKGHPSCKDSSMTTVNLTLSAGWSVVYLKERQSDFKTELINAPSEAVLRNWNW